MSEAVVERDLIDILGDAMREKDDILEVKGQLTDTEFATKWGQELEDDSRNADILDDIACQVIAAVTETPEKFDDMSDDEVLQYIATALLILDRSITLKEWA